MKVAIIILTILVVGLTGYIVYDKVLSDKDTNITDGNNNTNDDNTQDYEEEIDTSDHVELDKTEKEKLIKVFKFVYDYGYSHFHGNYCVGDTNKKDKIKASSDSELLLFHVASTEYSSFEEAKIKYSNPYPIHIYTIIEVKFTTGEEFYYELYDVTFTKKITLGLFQIMN